jgi:MoaA/NifB/PqqE/SkfB family radical SAM enzyme
MCKSFLEQERHVMLTLSFSVDGLAETHGRIRGKPDTFANLCKTIDHLSPWREKYPNLRLRVNSVVTPDNIDEMQATVDYFYKQYRLDEHGLEIVRDLTWLGAHHDSPERKGIAKRYVELVEYSYNLYYRNGGTERRRQLGVLPERLSNLMTYAYSREMAEVKHDRIMGQLWPFPCTAGRKIVVVNGSGSLRACEHRGEVVDLRKFDFDYGKAMATGLMDKEIAQIHKDHCDCIHGCFVGNSLQHSPKALFTRLLPKVLEGMTSHSKNGTGAA